MAYWPVELTIETTNDRYDAILVDGYTHDGIPQSLASHRFHRDCRQALRTSGVLVSNLHGPEVGSHVAHVFDFDRKPRPPKPRGHVRATNDFWDWPETFPGWPETLDPEDPKIRYP